MGEPIDAVEIAMRIHRKREKVKYTSTAANMHNVTIFQTQNKVHRAKHSNSNSRKEHMWQRKYRVEYAEEIEHHIGKIPIRSRYERFNRTKKLILRNDIKTRKRNTKHN